MPPDRADPALWFVHQGWDHLKQQRPVAAWASWQRALRIDPDHKAATQALDVLAAAGDLPLAARLEYRFLPPADEPARARWDEQLRGADLEDLAVAANVFGRLADGDPADGRARINQAYCLAWQGENTAAIRALDQAVRALADSAPELAIPAWALTEVLRQGGGAEPLADDLNHAAVIQWDAADDDDDDPGAFLDGHPDVVARPAPIDPAVGGSPVPEAQVYEWLDGPPTAGPDGVARRVLARVIRLPRSLRLSSPDPAGLDAALGRIPARARARVASARREATPLPLTFLDAAVWAVRLPTGVDPDAEGRLHRDAVEAYYEGAWLHLPRHGLDGRTPIEAGRLAAAGDTVARARLAAVIAFREQLAERPTALALYQGYPFDRLRRRLGLGLPDPAVVDPHDPTSMAGSELDALDPAALDDVHLADAYESAAMLGDDDRTARFAAVLADREPGALARLDVPALGRLDRAHVIDQALHQGHHRRTFATWRAEILARVGRPDAAVRAYDEVLALASEPETAAVALDAAETLLDNGHEDHAARLARRARQAAQQAGDAVLAERAAALVPGVDGEGDLPDE